MTARRKRSPALRHDPRKTADVSVTACASPFFSVEQMARRHPAFSAGTLRWQIFNAASNGLDDARAVLRLGRRVLIDEPRYFEWVRSQGVQR